MDRVYLGRNPSPSPSPTLTGGTRLEGRDIKGSLITNPKRLPSLLVLKLILLSDFQFSVVQTDLSRFPTTEVPDVDSNSRGSRRRRPYPNPGLVPSRSYTFYKSIDVGVQNSKELIGF